MATYFLFAFTACLRPNDCSLRPGSMEMGFRCSPSLVSPPFTLRHLTYATSCRTSGLQTRLTWTCKQRHFSTSNHCKQEGLWANDHCKVRYPISFLSARLIGMVSTRVMMAKCSGSRKARKRAKERIAAKHMFRERTALPRLCSR